MNEESFFSNEWHMLELRGELEEESHLIEVKKTCIESLRNRTSFLFFNTTLKQIYLWHGTFSSDSRKELIRKCCKKLKDRYLAVDFQVKELNESSECDAELLKPILNDSFRNNTLVSSSNYQFTPRLFLMTTLYGKFETKEILNPLRVESVYCPYPFFQSNLYNQEQPSLFMIDNNEEIYLWQGWYELYPEEISKLENPGQNDMTYGTTKLRFNKNRRCAMETAIKYWTKKNPNKEFNGFIVYAGLEPKEFKDFFPLWETNENARKCNLNDGKIPDQKDSILDILSELNRNCYPASVLREKPLPDGVNPLTLECYLSDKEFEELLKTTKEDFSSLPLWKQSNLKKNAQLF